MDLAGVARSEAFQDVRDSILARLNENRASLADRNVVEEDQANSLQQSSFGHCDPIDVFENAVDEC